jgi:hypothetical protein
MQTEGTEASGSMLYQMRHAGVESRFVLGYGE